MSELISFSSIDIYSCPEAWDENHRFLGYDHTPWTEEQVEAADFLGKMDWEGGLDGLIQYGGASIFPEELQELASEYELAHNRLSAAVNDWAAERGVEY